MLELLNDVLLQCNTCKRIIPFLRSDLDFSREECYDHGINGMGDEVRYIIEDDFICPNCMAKLSYSICGIEYPLGAFDSIHKESAGCRFVDLPRMQVVYHPELDYDYSYKDSLAYSNASHIRIIMLDIAYHKDLMYDLNPRIFEEIVAQLFEDRGFEVALTPATRDNGKDVIATKYFNQDPCVFYIECKRFDKGYKVGNSIVDRLLGVQAREKANKVILVTTSSFTLAARMNAKTMGTLIGLVDGEQLFSLICESRNMFNTGKVV